ncbi:MAG: MBL fold metallo-hydrolase [Actinomycetota bacterium]|nr:MBL fold metallo-hydrolase [Actinomycetota bacterium]
MFDIDIIETPSLGDRSYLLSDGIVAAVIDPQRDIDRILQVATSRDVRISHVLETHLHNDYVSGGVELAAATGAAYLLSADDDVSFDRHPIRDGDVVTVGQMRLRAIHTPGHTHHHLSYALQNSDGDAEAVFTGGSLLYASAGRTDLLGAEHTEALTHAQYRSVQRLARELAGDTRVMPTHGFGSFCSATPTSGEESTIAEQRQVNPALSQDEQAFVDELIAGLDAYPAYYAHMGALNSATPNPVDLSMPALVDSAELRTRIEAGQWVVDLRSRTAFAAGHLAGSLSFELSDNFIAYLGWLYPWGDALTLIGDTPEQILDARRELVRIGVDRLDGAAIGDPTLDARAAHIRSYPVTDFAGLATALADDQVHVLDTRRNDERAKSAIPDSQHIPLHELPGRLDEVPTTEEVWVHCGSGYRAAIAASLLDNGSRRLVHIDDDYAHAEQLGLASPASDGAAAS